MRTCASAQSQQSDVLTIPRRSAVSHNYLGPLLTSLHTSRPWSSSLLTLFMCTLPRTSQSRAGSRNSRTCLVQAAESPTMSDDAVAAMRAPLPALSRSGSWSAACANCTAGASVLASVAQQDQAAFRQHCLDCGFGASSSAFRARAAGERPIRKIDL